MASNNDPLHGQQILPFYLVGDTGSAPVGARAAGVGWARRNIDSRSSRLSAGGGQPAGRGAGNCCLPVNIHEI